MWTYEVYKPDGTLLCEFNNARNRTFNMLLNSVKRATFSLDIHDEKTISDFLHVGRNELKIKKGDTYFFGGVITNIRDRIGTVDVIALSYEWWLTKRILESGDSSVDTGYSCDVGQIIKGLIDETQTKESLGLTQGTIETSLNRERNYKIFDNVWHLIKLLTRYVDFEIKPNKEWNVYYPQKGVERNIEFTYPGSIFSFVYEKDATDLVNELYMKGTGLDDAVAVGQSEDTTQQGIYHLLQDSGFYSSSNDTVLDQEAEKRLADVKAPIERITQIKIRDGARLGEYFVGDTVRIKIKHGSLLDINALYRIEEIEVQIDSEDIETIKLGVVNA